MEKSAPDQPIISRPPSHQVPPCHQVRARTAAPEANMSGCVVIFGATGTIGRAMLRFVTEEQVLGSNIKVVAVGADEAKCKEVEKQFKDVTAVCCDAKSMKEVEAVFEKHKGEGIIGVANLIGDYHYCPLPDLEEGDLMTIMQDNLVASFNILKAAAPLMAASGAGGSICCVGAAVVSHGMKHHEAWAAAKGAIEAMYRNAAATYAPHNVRINCVAAGLVESPASSEVSRDQELSGASAGLYPLKRLATPDDIAWAACWLVHPKTTFTTGVALPVDGGLSSCQAVGLAKPAAESAATS